MTAQAFFTELRRIIQSQPKLHSRSNDSENCDYGDQLYYCKNMSYSFDCLKSSDCVYLFDCHICANCCDCDYTIESQLCYECVDAFKCFNSNYLEDCTNVRDSAYSYNCKDCANVFGCVNLTSKSFCLFNRQLTEEEYHREVKQYEALPPEKILAFVEELKNKYPRTQTHGENNENSPFGNYVYNCKNCYLCFDTDKSENSAYLYDSGGHKTCYDSTFSGAGQLSYESIDSTHLFNCDFTIWSGYCADSSYLLSCSNVKNSLGCVNLYQKQYCILNRQFTKEEYEVKSKEILDELKKANLGWADISF